MENNYNEQKNTLRVQTALCDRQIVTELASDFSLPDYQPEIKRLLRVGVSVCPPDKYIGAGNAEFTGTLEYTVLYAGHDGALYCAAQKQEYRFSAPLEMTADFDLNEGVTSDVCTVTDMAVGRVAAPRKLSLKCRLRSRVRLWGTRVIEERLTGNPATALQRLCGEVQCAQIYVGSGEVLQLGDEILLDAQSADLRVICAEGQVFISEALPGSGGVTCRGEVCLKLLCCHEADGGVPITQWRRIPFTQTVPVDGMGVNCDACADGVCSDIRVTVEENRILCEASVLLRARAQRNAAQTFTRDLYSTDAECETTFSTDRFAYAVKSVNGNFSLNHTATLEELGLREGMTPLDLTLTPTVQSLECDRGKCYLVGKCRAQWVLSDGEEITAQESEIPFRYETDIPDTGITDYDATVVPLSCRTRLDGQRVAIDAELGVCLALCGEVSCRRLSEACFGEPISRAGAVYTICYPASDDTLWSVAKRYHRSVYAISDLNGLAGAPAADTRESLSGIGYLLV